MTVCVMDTRDNSYKRLYGDVLTLEETELLTQLAMNKKKDNELVFVLAGWNRGIQNNDTEYNRALQLATKYKEKDSSIYKGSDNDLKFFKERMKKYIDSL